MKKFKLFVIHHSSVNSFYFINLVYFILLLNLNFVKSNHQFFNQLIKSPPQCFCFGLNSSEANCTLSNYGVRVITSNFEIYNHNLKELNWQIVNLTSIILNNDINKLIYYDHMNRELLDQHQQDITTIELSNDLNEFLQPIHLKNYLSFSDDDLFNKNLYYWQASDQYIGNKLYAYSNELQFKLSFSVLRGDVASNKCNYQQDADVLMAGLIENRLYFIGFKWRRYQNKFKCDIPITIRIKLKENQWFRLDHNFKLTNQTIDRLEFTLILNSLRVLLIRASYHSDQIEARLYTVTMGITDVELENGELFQAKNIEKCSNCPDYTTGIFCSKCIKHFYGNPVINLKCKACECPQKPNTGIYHADGCLLDQRTNGFTCQCKKGYIGERCDRCDVNYYGNPNSFDGECKKCDCNGNVDFNDIGVCDPITGRCLKCLYNTEGDHCERCKENFFGDALKQSCKCITCNVNYTEPKYDCDHKHTGYYNHSSVLCELCPSRTYKKYLQYYDKQRILKNSYICEDCNCNIQGSLNNGNCESASGKCSCKKGFEGLKCERCSIGYEIIIKKNGINCASCDSNQTRTNNCIYSLKNDIQQLHDISRDYSFDTLKSLPAIKLNNFKDQIAKQRENINYLVEYEQRVNQGK